MRSPCSSRDNGPDLARNTGRVAMGHTVLHKEFISGYNVEVSDDIEGENMCSYISHGRGATRRPLNQGSVGMINPDRRSRIESG